MHSVEPLNWEQKTPRLNPFGVLLAKQFNGAREIRNRDQEPITKK